MRVISPSLLVEKIRNETMMKLKTLIEIEEMRLKYDSNYVPVK